MRFEMWKSKAQKGAFLVFTALMIPIIFLCAGFAVDLGNAWAYKSKLQNAADAAALAGAKEYGDNGTETVDKHDDADAQAERFLIANLGNDYFKTHLAEGSTGKVRYQMKPLTQNDSRKTYYRVYLSAKTDTTFMKMFNYDHMNVGVEAVAVVPQKQQGGFDALFVTKNGFTDQSEINGDQHEGQTTEDYARYSGHIYVADENKYNYYKANNDQYGRYKFFKPETLGKQYNEVENDKSLYEEVQLIKNSNYDEATVETRNYLQSIAEQNKYTTDSIVYSWDRQDVPIPLSRSSSYDYYYIDINQPSVTVHLKNIPAKTESDKDKPVYIFFEGKSDVTKVFLDDDVTDRPIIICYLGKSVFHPEWGNSYDHQFIFTPYNHTFRGTIFAPYASVDFNAETCIFHGSIFAESLFFRTHHGKFYFEDHHVIQGFTGGSGGGQTGSSTELKLVISDKEGLTWSDD